MRNRLNPSLRNEPNMVPMIDIMLVLLIIFMVITPLITNGFQAIMPEGQNLSPRPDDEKDVVLGIDKYGMYFLNGQPVAKDILSTRLGEIFARRDSNKVMFLRADKDLEFREIQDAFELARHSGVRVMGMVTEKSQTFR